MRNNKTRKEQISEIDLAISIIKTIDVKEFKEAYINHNNLYIYPRENHYEFRNKARAFCIVIQWINLKTKVGCIRYLNNLINDIQLDVNGKNEKEFNLILEEISKLKQKQFEIENLVTSFFDKITLNLN